MSSPEIGPPDFETSDEVKILSNALDMLAESQTTTLDIFASYLDIPAVCMSNHAEIRASVEQEVIVMEEVFRAYCNMDMDDYYKLSGLECVLAGAQERRAAFFERLGSGVKLPDDEPRAELIDSLFERLANDDDFSLEESWEIGDAYKDALQCDLDMAGESLQEALASEPLELTRKVGHYFSDISKIAIGVALGSYIIGRTRRRYLQS